MESKFKVGDKVVCVKEEGWCGNVFAGNVLVLTDCSDDFAIGDNTLFVELANDWPEDFELYKEEPVKQFDMHTQPWFIRVNNEQEFHLVQEWLKENFGRKLNSKYEYATGIVALTNTTSNGDVLNDQVMWTVNPSNTFRHEIKVKFKTIIDSVEWPIVESEKDKKIRELQETIKKAEEQIKELQKLS